MTQRKGEMQQKPQKLEKERNSQQLLPQFNKELLT
jgi:hypothetical protein